MKATGAVQKGSIISCRRSNDDVNGFVGKQQTISDLRWGPNSSLIKLMEGFDWVLSQIKMADRAVGLQCVSSAMIKVVVVVVGCHFREPLCGVYRGGGGETTETTVTGQHALAQKDNCRKWTFNDSI